MFNGSAVLGGMNIQYVLGVVGEQYGLVSQNIFFLYFLSFLIMTFILQI